MFLAVMRRGRYTILCMGYKYFDEGLNGETGRQVDKLYERKLNENLRDVFQYPLRIERSNPKEEVEIPAVPFHIVQVGLPNIRQSDDIDSFGRLLREVPNDIHLILDMSGVESVDSAALAPLLQLHKSMRGKASVILVNLERAVDEKMRITKLDTFFRVRRTTQAAYEEIQRTAA